MNARVGSFLRSVAPFMLITFLSGCAAALFVPTMSLFLSQEVKVSPFAVGIFFTCNAVCGIMVSQFLARRSDRKGQRRKLIFLCMLAGAASCLLFAFTRSYWLLITAGILLMSIGATASPQIFALAREYSDRLGRSGVMFTSWMRAMFSLAWVVGPPIAFAVSLNYGFMHLFLFGLGIYLLSALVVHLGLPVVHRDASANLEMGPVQNNQTVRWLFASSTLFWTCNNMYLIAMPLYVTSQLGRTEGLAGWMMGTAAGLEIPIMLIAGWLCSRWRKHSLLMISGVAAIGFYVAMLTQTEPFLLLLSQVGNALFIGILAGMGMLYFQDMLPGQAGVATTLFTNSIRSGAILAGALAGGIAEYYDYHAVFIAALLMSIIGLMCLWHVGRIERTTH
ncbi:sugar efflux transporter [Pseudaeromonas sharmana]|uniref:Sugar efflux transporter n=1 Tax=Pseudaeromonas sharmana TaxID=328412 RepID=A0ABV8CNU0_9GAMM